MSNKPLRRLIIDLGNSFWKGWNGSESVTVPHALLELSQAEFNNIIKLHNDCPPPDYGVVNGTPYVIGESAEKHGTLTKMTGQAKYTPEYYGVGLAAIAARLWQTSGELIVYASYPPGSTDYSDDLMDAAIGAHDGQWQVWIEGREVKFSIVYVNVFREPVGGVMNVLLNKEGTLYQKPELTQGNIIAIDWGGGTIDFSGVFPDGSLNGAIQDSVNTGINTTYDYISKNLRQQHREKFKGIKFIPPARIRYALKNGIYQGNGDEIPCQDIVNAGVNMLLNQFIQGYNDIASGGADADAIVLTGAGYVDLYDRIVPLLNFNPQKVYKAGKDKEAQLSNVFGGEKQLRMFETTGVVTYD